MLLHTNANTHTHNRKQNHTLIPMHECPSLKLLVDNVIHTVVWQYKPKCKMLTFEMGLLVRVSLARRRSPSFRFFASLEFSRAHITNGVIANIVIIGSSRCVRLHLN